MGGEFYGASAELGCVFPHDDKTYFIFKVVNELGMWQEDKYAHIA